MTRTQAASALLSPAAALTGEVEQAGQAWVAWGNEQPAGSSCHLHRHHLPLLLLHLQRAQM